MSIEGIDDIYECDEYGEIGDRMGWLLYGSVTPEDVEQFINEDWDVLDATHPEYGNHAGNFDAIECYVRKVPTQDGGGWRYAYTGSPGPGARKCVRVEFYSSWGRWCVNHPYEPASTGVPVTQVSDPPWPQVLDNHVYLCAPCSRSFRERYDAAMRAALRCDA